MTFGNHVKTIARRAGQRLGILKRASRIVDSAGLASIYKGFVRPVMEYSSVSWMSAAPSHLSRLDRIQARASRTIGVDVHLDSLGHRRKVGALTYLFKLPCDGCPVQVKSIVPPGARMLPKPRTRKQLAARDGHSFQLQDTLGARTPDGLRRAFPHCILHDWNSLSTRCFDGGVSFDSLQRFKELVHQEMLKKNA